MGLAPYHHLPLAAVHAHTIARSNPRFGSSSKWLFVFFPLTVRGRGVGFGRRPWPNGHERLDTGPNHHATAVRLLPDIMPPLSLSDLQPAAL